MAITIDDFSKIWASTSPLTPYSFSESNYKEGWNFVGSTPPSRQMWDFLQKNNDEKMQYLANNYLPLSGGTMTGDITMSTAVIKKTNNSDNLTICGGSDTSANSGAKIDLCGADNPYDGAFILQAGNENGYKQFKGLTNGSLTWNEKEVERVNASGNGYIRYESGIQICWGSNNYSTAGTFTVNFAQPFISTPALCNNSNATYNNINAWCNATYMTFSKDGTGSTTVFYIAIGKWK